MMIINSTFLIGCWILVLSNINFLQGDEYCCFASISNGNGSTVYRRDPVVGRRLAFIQLPDKSNEIESFSEKKDSTLRVKNDLNDDEMAATYEGAVVAASDSNGRTKNDAKRRGIIDVSASIELPFPKSIAYDAFSDLSRFSLYSSWLRSVEYIDDGERHVVGSKTRWNVSYLGFQFTWNAISTRQDPNLGIIEWESITGLKNNGRVTFDTINKTIDGDTTTTTLMNLTMSFVVPKIAARLLGPTKLASIIEQRILYNTLCNFRRMINENDWKAMEEDN